MSGALEIGCPIGAEWHQRSNEHNMGSGALEMQGLDQAAYKDQVHAIDHSYLDPRESDGAA